MNYHHLSIEERSCIRKYYVDGLSYREIARLIGRNVSTISREIRRNCTHMYDIPTYYSHTAQKKYLLRRSYCHRGMFHSQEGIDYINEKLEATWSPEQIACTPCELKMPSWRTIYRWIYVQPERSRTLGSGYGCERPGKKQSLFSHLGRAENTLLYCVEDSRPKGRNDGERHRFYAFRLSFPVGQDDYLRPRDRVCQLAQHGRTPAL